MQVEFEKTEYIRVKLFSASFGYTLPIVNPDSDVWKRIADSEVKSMTIWLSNIMSLPPDTIDVELVKKEYEMISFRSPIRGISDEIKSGGETQIPFQYCQEAFKKIADYLEAV